MITITCDRCEHQFAVDENAGERVACPKCGDINRIPVAGFALPPKPAVAPSVAADAAEETVAVVRQAMFRAHPFWYSLMVLLVLGGLTAAGLAAASVVAAPFSIGGLAVAAIGFVWWLVWWLAPHRWIKLTITTKRTIRQEGIVMRKTSEVLHRHVTNVIIKQGPLDRLLNVGYLGLDTAGQGGEPGREPGRTSIEIEVYDIPKPYEVKSLIDKYRLA